MGRPPIGKTAMSATERWRRHRDKLAAARPAAKEHKPAAPDDPLDLPATFGKTQRERFDAAIRAHIRQLDRQFADRVQAEVAHLLKDTVLPTLADVIDHAQEITAAYKGIMSRADFRGILACLHPDTASAAWKERHAQAFNVFRQLERVLVKTERRPTDVPKTLDELLKRKAERQAEMAAKRRKAK